MRRHFREIKAIREVKQERYLPVFPDEIGVDEDLNNLPDEIGLEDDSNWVNDLPDEI